MNQRQHPDTYWCDVCGNEFNDLGRYYEHQTLYVKCVIKDSIF